MVATWNRRYALTTHAMPDTPPRSRVIDGNAVATIVPSIPEIIIPTWSPMNTTTNPRAVESVAVGTGFLMAAGIFLIASGCQKARSSREAPAHGHAGGTRPRCRRRGGRHPGRRVGRRGTHPRGPGRAPRDPQPIALRARRRARRPAPRPRAGL